MSRGASPIATKKTAGSAAVKTARRKPVKKAVPPAPAAAVESPAGPSNWQIAVEAALEKKATGVRALDLRPVTSFADYFVICNGANQRQIQAIADEVERTLKTAGERPNAVEGYTNAEWVLMDYGDMVVHVFTESARAYYDLDRLWRDAPELALPAATR